MQSYRESELKREAEKHDDRLCGHDACIKCHDKIGEVGSVENALTFASVKRTSAALGIAKRALLEGREK